MTRRNGGISASVIIKTSSIVDTSSLHNTVKVPPHTLNAIKKPPGRSQAQSWIMSSQGCQLPTIRRLIKIEEHQGQIGPSPIKIQQRLQVACEFCSDRNISPFITTKTLEDVWIVIPQTTNVQLHDQSVLRTHTRQ